MSDIPELSTADLHVALADHVAVLEMRRPPTNFFDVDLIDAMATALERLAEEGDCRSAVLQSEGKHFCAGADFGSGGPSLKEGPHLYEVALRLFEQPLPIVAAVQGGAVGGGLGLALAADLRVACPEARFSANFARLGFHHGFALTETLPLAVGHQASLDLLYTGRRVGGEEAARLGLCDRLVPAEELRATAHELAADIARSAPLAVRSIRATMRGGLTDRVRAAVAHERPEQQRLMATDDWREGVAASAERREPRFHGR